MACLPLPSGCGLENSECYNSVHETCNTVDEGPPHDKTCEWHCKPPTTSTSTTAPNATTSSPNPNATTPIPNPTPEPYDKFCEGGMDMLMGGFETAGGSTQENRKTCVILFFQSWKLNSAGKFAAACLGVFVLGLGIEVLIWLRRKIISRKRLMLNLPVPARKLIVISLFGANLVLGYMAMLVAMTYSVELFICVVIGIIVGHALFNSSTPVGETIDPCCASQNNHDSSAEDHSSMARTPCDNVVYQEMGANGSSAAHDADTHSLCN